MLKLSDGKGFFIPLTCANFVSAKHSFILFTGARHPYHATTENLLHGVIHRAHCKEARRRGEIRSRKSSATFSKRRELANH